MNEDIFEEEIEEEIEENLPDQEDNEEISFETVADPTESVQIFTVSDDSIPVLESIDNSLQFLCAFCLIVVGIVVINKLRDFLIMISH